MKPVFVVILMLMVASDGQARTWRVNPAGTGDAPTLHAAMDSAVAGDIVVAEAGEYGLTSSLRVPKNVRLVGESGAGRTLLYRDAYLAPSMISLLEGASMIGIHARGNTKPVVYVHGANMEYCILEGSIPVTLMEGGGQFRNCLFVGGDIALPGLFVACIIMSDLGAYAVGSGLFYSNVLGYVHPSIVVSSNDLNFSLDPEFCGIPGSGNYFLRSTSPCAPGNNPWGPGGQLLVGPLSVGCGTVRIEERTWGGVKALYRHP